MAAAASGNWLAEDERKMLHAVYRVGDLDKTEEYYKTMFGMKRLRYRDQPDVRQRHASGAALLLMIGYGKRIS